MKTIRFNFKEKLILLFQKCCTSKRKINSKTPVYQKIFFNGEKLVKNQLNLYTVIETLMKLKASISILVGEDEKIMSKIK